MPAVPCRVCSWRRIDSTRSTVSDRSVASRSRASRKKLRNRSSTHLGPMNLMWRALFVVCGIVVGSTAVNYYVFGNTADFAMQNGRIGAWRDGKVREACFGAMEHPESDAANPRLPPTPHRISVMDHD